MTDQPLTLRDIALMASDRFGGVRGRALGREAEKAGVRIVYTTIDKIIAGTYRSTPTAATLEALAELSGVPIEHVYRAAALPLPQAPLAAELPAGADSLTAAQREVVIGAIRQFVSLNRQLAGELVWDDEYERTLAEDLALNLVRRHEGNIDQALQVAQEDASRMELEFYDKIVMVLRDWRRDELAGEDLELRRAGYALEVELTQAARRDPKGKLSRGQLARKALDGEDDPSAS